MKQYFADYSIDPDEASAEQDAALEALAALEREAAECHDGHFTIMRFTTNWRVCLGTGTTIRRMAAGQTLTEAIWQALNAKTIA